MTLRDYQRAALDAVAIEQAAGKRRVVLYGPTGSGKTVLAQAWATEHPDERMLFVVDLVTLVDQTAKRFRDAGIDVGVLQASNTRDLKARVIVASAQTLAARQEAADTLLPSVRHLWVDECHYTRDSTLRAMAVSVKAGGYVVGLTATPFSAALSGWDGIVSTATTTGLQHAGHLASVKVEQVWDPPDLAGVARGVNDEWQDGAVAEAIAPHVGTVVERTVNAIRRHGMEDAPAIAFAATVKHANALADALGLATGRRWESVSYKTAPAEAQMLIEDYRAGRVHGLVSVAKLAVGFDVPDAAVAILNRPLDRSLSMHLQQVGRVLRPAAGKTHALVLDASGNWDRFRKATRQVWNNGVRALPRPRSTKKRDRSWTCECGAVNPPALERCARCGREQRSPDIETDPEARKCHHCSAENSSTAPVCTSCFVPFVADDSVGVSRCAVHGLILEETAEGGTLCPMPGCDVGTKRDEQVDLPTQEPQRSLFVLACQHADMHGEDDAREHFKWLCRKLGTHWPAWHVPKAGTRASYALIDQDVYRKLQALVNRSRYRRRRSRRVA